MLFSKCSQFLVGEADKYINCSDPAVCDSSVMEMAKKGTLREHRLCPGGQGRFLREGIGVRRQKRGKGLPGRKCKRSL